MSTPPAVPGATATVRPNEAEIRGKRGRKPGTQAKVRQEIPAEQFKFENIAPESRGYLRRQRLERSKQQQAADVAVMVVYREWVQEGEPNDWNKMPVKGWVINKNLAEDALFMLAKAVGLHSKKLVTGKVQEKPLPNLPLEPGNVRIPFCVINRRTKTVNVPGEETEGEPDSAE